MSAVVVTIRSGDEFWQKPYLWVTERYVEAWKERMPQWQAWEAADDVVIVPGEMMDYDAIYEQIDQINDVLPIRGVVYDQTYAGPLIAWLEKNLRKAEPVKFEQNSTMYEGRIDEFEAAVKTRTLIHDNNRCMTWQAGHCETKPNARGNRILIKPVSKDDPRKIDGMVASVMSRYGATAIDLKQSSYKRRGVLTV